MMQIQKTKKFILRNSKVCVGGGGCGRGGGRRGEMVKICVRVGRRRIHIVLQIHVSVKVCPASAFQRHLHATINYLLSTIMKQRLGSTAIRKSMQKKRTCTPTVNHTTDE